MGKALTPSAAQHRVGLTQLFVILGAFTAPRRAEARLLDVKLQSLPANAQFKMKDGIIFYFFFFLWEKS